MKYKFLPMCNHLFIASLAYLNCVRACVRACVRVCRWKDKSS